jgi:5-methyltetrahydropteroyltriglutamate--homocysteine methyltransferase
VHQVSIETAQSGLDCSVLKTLPGKTIILGTLDLSDMTIEAPETVAARIAARYRMCLRSGSSWRRTAG